MKHLSSNQVQIKLSQSDSCAIKEKKESLKSRMLNEHICALSTKTADFFFFFKKVLCLSLLRQMLLSTCVQASERGQEKKSLYMQYESHEGWAGIISTRELMWPQNMQESKQTRFQKH